MKSSSFNRAGASQPRHARVVCAWPHVVGALVASATLAACSRQDASTAPGTNAVSRSGAAAPVATAVPGPPRSAPQFGGVKTQEIITTGTGPTVQAAVDNALQLAVEEVNGTRVSSVPASSTTAPVELGENATPDQIRAYASWVTARTQGAIQGFRILSQKSLAPSTVTTEESLRARQGPSHDVGSVSAAEGSAIVATDGSGGAGAVQAGAVAGQWDRATGARSLDYHAKRTELKANWEVKIAAEVAKYSEPASAKRTRIVVAMPDAQAVHYQVGQNELPAADLGRQIQQSLEDALTQSNRFTVLDRQDDAQIESEMNVIRSGQATVADTARLGQKLATDLIVVPTIVAFGYNPHVQHLSLANRDLVWYSGGGEVNLRIVNAATGQLVLSQSFRNALPRTEPTTLGVAIDGAAITAKLVKSLDEQMATVILQNTFPPEVLRVDGRQVTINQGGDLIQAGTDYRAVYLGQDIEDPQSGVNLGPSEKPCCTIHIDSVSPTLSYGHVIEDGFTFPASFAPGSIELRDIVKVALASASGSDQHTQKRKALAKKAPKKKTDTNW